MKWDITAQYYIQVYMYSVQSVSEVIVIAAGNLWTTSITDRPKNKFLYPDHSHNVTGCFSSKDLVGLYFFQNWQKVITVFQINPAEKQINRPPQQRQQFNVLVVKRTAFVYSMVQCLVPNHRFIKPDFKCSSSDVIKYWLVDSSYRYTIKINACSV